MRRYFRIGSPKVCGTLLKLILGLPLILVPLHLYAGSFLDSSFTNFDGDSIDPGRLRYQDSFSIAKEYDSLYAPGGAFRIDTSNNRTKTSGVVCTGPVSFTTFWMRKGFRDTYARRTIQVEGSTTIKGAVSTQTLELPASNPDDVLGLMAAGNQAGKYMVSWYDAINRFYTINNYGRGTKYCDVVGGGAQPRSSMAWWRGDSALVCYPLYFTDLYVQVLRSTSTSIIHVDTQRVLQSTSNLADQIWNPSVTVDPAGYILILWRKGFSTAAPKLIYTLLTPARMLLATGTLDPDITDPPTSNNYQYPDAKAFAYDTLRFAVTYFKAGQAHLIQCAFNSLGGLTTSNQTVLSTSGKFPTITGNQRYIFTAWNEDEGSIRRIRGRRFRLSNGDISLTDTTTRLLLSPTNIDFSRTDSTAAIQAAMDTLGNIVTVFTSPETAYASCLSNTPVVYDSAFYVSHPESVGTPGLWPLATDSIRFVSCGVDPDTNLGNGAYYRPGIATGPSITSFGSWVEINNNGSFASTLIGKDRYFRIRLRLYAPNRLFSPRVDSIRVHWNIKPRAPSCDSIYFNTAKRSLAQAETLVFEARKDSARLFFSAVDLDDHGSMQWTSREGGSTSISSLVRSTTATYAYNNPIGVFPMSISARPCSVFVADSLGWQSDAFRFFVRAVNHPPQFSVTGIADTIGEGRRDTIAVSDSMFLSVQSADSTTFKIACRDSNDTALSIAIYRDGVKVDSVYGDSLFVYSFDNDQAANGFAFFTIRVSDPETTLVSHVRVGVNHPPVIDSLRGPENASSRSIGRIKAQPGRTNTFVAVVNEPDLARGDRLAFRWRLNNLLLVSQSETCSVRISPGDTILSFYVQDLAGRRDSAAFRLEYPYWEAGTPEFQSALQSFSDSLSFIVGGFSRDTLGVTISNTGTANLIITGVHTKLNDSKWLSFRVANTYFVRESTQVSQMPAAQIQPGQSLGVAVYFRADSLRGDGEVVDTLLIETSDYINPVLRVPMRVIYNDLPFIGSFGFNFTAALPLAKQRAATPRFPPNANLVFAFSEALDTSTVRSGITVFSRLDSADERALVPIGCTYTFSSNADTVRFKAAYTRASPHFGFRPPAGLFISTDVIAVRIANTLKDRAGNRLDIHQNKIRIASAETTFVAAVDSSPFQIVHVEPRAGDTSVDANAVIRVVFSRSIKPSSVDTSLAGNTTIQVATGYSSGTAVELAYVRIDSTSITVKTKEAFFNRDSVIVRLSGRIRDQFGYSIEANGDGVPSFLYDSTSVSDAIAWSFRTKATPFYVFPNPYEPSHQPRHAEIGGIVFKNLNRLSASSQRIEIQILSLKGHLLYSTRKAGLDLIFREGTGHQAPAWKWNTCNQYGNQVGSGVYYYIIRAGDSVVKKGKVMIIR